MRAAIHADEIATLARDLQLLPEQRDVLQAALAALVSEINADTAASDAIRRSRRSERLATFRAVSAALDRVVNAIELARPTGADALREVMAPDLGLMLATGAFGQLIDIPIATTVSFHVLEGRTATRRGGPYDALEQEMAARRQMVARRHGDRMVVAFAKRLASRLRGELALERLNTGGRPVDRPRRIALIRILQLYEQFIGRPVGAQPSIGFLRFAASCLTAVGIDSKGSDRAAERLFDQLRKARKPPP